MTITDIILNMIIVSIPEELFMVLMALVIMGRYDFFDKYTVKKMFKKVLFIAVIPSVLFFTFTLFKLNINIYLRLFINLIAFTISIMILTKEKKILRLFAATTISYFLIIIFEFLTGTLFIYVFKVNNYSGGTSALTNFAMSLPSRILQYGFLYITYLNKNSIVKVKLIDIWRSNQIFRRLIYISITFNMIIGVFIFNKFTIEKCIQNLNYETQLFIITVILIMFIYIMVMPWITLYSVYPSEKLRRK